MSPWFHRGGNYCAGPNTVFYVGAEAVTLPQFDPGLVLDLVEDHRLTYVIGAPTNLERLADEQEAKPRDLSTLKGIVTMGAPFERAAALRYQQRPDAAHLERLRHHRGLLEHVPAPATICRRRRRRRTRLDRRRRRGRQASTPSGPGDPASPSRKTARRSARSPCAP